MWSYCLNLIYPSVYCLLVSLIFSFLLKPHSCKNPFFFHFKSSFIFGQIKNKKKKKEINKRKLERNMFLCLICVRTLTKSAETMASSVCDPGNQRAWWENKHYIFLSINMAVVWIFNWLTIYWRWYSNNDKPKGKNSFPARQWIYWCYGSRGAI